MATYPPRLRFPVPGGEYYQPGDGGTQYVEPDGTIYKPTSPAATLPPLDFSGLPAAPAARVSTAPVAEVFNQAPALTIGQPDAPTGGGIGGFVKTAGSAVAGKAQQAGKAIADNPMGAVNAALGIAGAIQYATAKAPKLPGKPDTYAPVIRPAQGLNQQALEAGRAQIQAGQRQASRPQGSDTGTGVMQRLVAQRQAVDGQNQLTLRDAEVFQQDQRREDEQRNQAYDANYKTQRSYQEKVFDLGQRAYESRRQQAAGMTQSALTYFTQQQGAKRQQQQMQQESQNRQAESKNALLAGELRAATDPARRKALADQLLKNDPNATSTVRALAPDLFAAGGKLTVVKAGKRTITPLPNSVDSRHAMSKQFGQQMERITHQAMRAFQQTLSQASQRRGKGIRS